MKFSYIFGNLGNFKTNLMRNQRSKCYFCHHDHEDIIELSVQIMMTVRNQKFNQVIWELNRILVNHHNVAAHKNHQITINQLSILVIIKIISVLLNSFTTHLWCIHLQPIISFSKIIENDSTAIV